MIVWLPTVLHAGNLLWGSHTGLRPQGKSQRNLTGAVREQEEGRVGIWRDRTGSSHFLFRQCEALCPLSRTKKTRCPCQPHGDHLLGDEMVINGQTSTSRMISSSHMCSEGHKQGVQRKNNGGGSLEWSKRPI